MTVKKIKRFTSNFHRYEINSENHKFDTELLFTSDWHFDNPMTNRKMIFNHLDEAKRRNALIIINGDLLCLMQGKYDPRGSKSSIRPEHNGDNYLDLVINDTADKLVPYANNILQINQGNHETSVSKRSETNVLQRLVERINALAGSNIQLGAYRGFININFSYKNCSFKSLNIGYSHGNWGGIVTKGVLSVNRDAAIMDNVDIMISGHTHDRWIVELNRLIPDPLRGRVINKSQFHVKTGTYKEEFEEGEGWAVERIGTPKSLGSVFCKVFYSQKQDLELEFTPTRQYY